MPRQPAAPVSLGDFLDRTSPGRTSPGRAAVPTDTVWRDVLGLPRIAGNVYAGRRDDHANPGNRLDKLWPVDEGASQAFLLPYPADRSNIDYIPIGTRLDESALSSYSPSEEGHPKNAVPENDFLRPVRDYFWEGLEALSRIPEDLGRFGRDFYNDPQGTAKSLGPVLGGLAPAVPNLPGWILAVIGALRASRLFPPGTSAEDPGPPPSSFMGSSENQYQAPSGVPPRNRPAMIGGVRFTGHVLDQAQNRGITISVIMQALRTGRRSFGKDGMLRIYDPVNRITLVQDPVTKNIVTIWPGP
jgi:hypothetical protein